MAALHERGAAFFNPRLNSLKIKRKMSTRKGIGYSPITDKVYLGRQDREKGLWIGEKEDITSDFLRVSHEYFGKNTVRTINVSNGSTEFFIHCGDSKAEIESAIKHLKSLL